MLSSCLRLIAPADWPKRRRNCSMQLNIKRNCTLKDP